MKETLKSIFLFFEIVLMLLLLFLTWGYAQGMGAIEEILALPFSDERPSAGPDSYFEETQWSAMSYPLASAVRYNHFMYGTIGDFSVTSAIYDRIKPVLAEAIGSAGRPEAVPEQDLAGILDGDMICFSFDGAVPIYAIGAWQGIDPSETFSPDERTSFLLLSAQGESLFLYYRSADTGALYRVATAARASALEPLFLESRPNGAFFAAHGGREYSGLLPETLLLNGLPPVETIRPEIPSFLTGSETAGAILAAFSYNAYTVRKYPEADGTQVYVEELSTIRLTPSGEMLYSIQPRAEEGLPIEGLSLLRNEGDRRLLIMSAAYEMLSHIFSSFGNSNLYMTRIDYNDNTATYTLTFGCHYGGTPITLASGAPAALVEVRGDDIVTVSAHLRRYDPAGESVKILPVLQAAAAARAEGKTDMSIRYMDSGDSVLWPGWYSAASPAIQKPGVK